MLSQLAFQHVCATFPSRDVEIRQLFSLYSPVEGSPPICVIHGPEATGKSSIVKASLEAIDVPHALVRVRECITTRHLLESTLAACATSAGDDATHDNDEGVVSRCENATTLAVHLQKLLKDKGHLVLILDGMDKQRESLPMLLPALARLGHMIPKLSVIFIVNFVDPLLLHLTGVPYILFRPYKGEELLNIVTQSPLCIKSVDKSQSSQQTIQVPTEDDKWVWSRYCAALWDSFGKSTAQDLISFRRLAEKLWRPFVVSIEDGTYSIKDFSKLMIAKRHLFQGENALQNNMAITSGDATQMKSERVFQDLPYYSKYILCAAYLASFSPPRKDILLFVKRTEKKSKKGGSKAGRPKKYRKVSRQLLMASPFSMDRLLAILHSIVPHSIPLSADIYSQISTLQAIRLLIRNIGVGADILDPSVRWKANFSWAYVHKIGRSIDLEIHDYVDNI